MHGFNSLFRVAMAGIITLACTSSAQARSEYNREFWALYQQELGKHAETTKCSVCHSGNDKKQRNDYGQAFGKALGGKGLKDADKIKDALQTVAKEKSSIDGKTFGDLIQAGNLPGKRPK
jgi:hypothetical protein